MRAVTTMLPVTLERRFCVFGCGLRISQLISKGYLLTRCFSLRRASGCQNFLPVASILLSALAVVDCQKALH